MVSNSCWSADFQTEKDVGNREYVTNIGYTDYNSYFLIKYIFYAFRTSVAVDPTISYFVD